MENQNPAQSEPVQNPIQSSQAPVPPIPPSINKPKRSFPIPKIVFLGIVFLILLAIIGSAYLLGKNNASKQSPTQTISQSPTPTVDPTADWQTYKSSRLSVSFNYPSTTKIKEGFDSKGFITNLNSKTITVTLNASSPDKSNDLKISIADNPNNLTPQKIIDNYKSSLTGGVKEMNEVVINKINSSLKEYKNKNISGLYAQFGADYDWEVIIQTIDNKIYTFVYQNTEESTKNSIDQILSTFKFTDAASQSLNASDWKTYESSEYDFSIKYPPSVTHEATNGPTQSNTYNQSHEFFKVNGGTLEIYGLCGRGVNPIKTESIVIAGTKTDKFYETETSGVIKAIDKPAGNGQLCFDFTLPNTQNKDIVDSTFDQILSTLKFTN